MWRATDPQCNESAKVRFDIVPYTRGRVLDIGCGPDKAFDHFIGVDNLHHAHAFGIPCRPDVVADACDLSLFADGSVDSVFSSHTLEHLEDPAKALREWCRTIKPGGHLVLYLPDDTQYPKVGEPGANKDHKFNVNYDVVVGLMEQIDRDWDLVRFERRDADFGPGDTRNEYSLLFVFRLTGSGHTFSWQNQPKPEKTAAVIRYGGVGDMIQAASVLPGLKRQGYHVTVFTTPAGHEIIKHDPHVDAFFIQDKDQVPNHELHAFFEYHRRRFDKWVNLCESVEGSLLALPGRPQRFWPKAARHAYMNHNYLEATHGIAGVPFEPAATFYPTDEEKAWACRTRQDMGGSMIILWSLSGSSVHKAWPWLDQIVARLLLTYAGVRIVLVGDTLCQVLEQGWEKEPRVIRRSGVWTIRESLTFAKQAADLVIGTETGLLNAVGLERVPKIVTLSHSSRENLTKHWRNCFALTPPASVHCYPCHCMHWSFKDCWRDEATGSAKCQAEISPESMWQAIQKSLPRPILKEVS